MLTQLLWRTSVLSVLALPVSAQTPLLHFEGDVVKDWFGHCARPAGDVDGDGVTDLVVGASQNLAPGHSPFPGYARVFSGATGGLLQEWSGDGTNWTDGPDDHFGASVDGAGDLDGDGLSDLIIGAYKDDNGGQQNAGLVRAFGGVSGAMLWQLDGAVPGDRLGIAVRRLGDVNADGVDDQLIGVYKHDVVSPENQGAVRVVDGTDGSTIYQKIGSEVGDLLGWSVARMNDIDGDGISDFVVGALQLENSSGGGYARVYSGIDGATIHTVNSVNLDDSFGWSVAGVGDVNGDGTDDFAVGAIEFQNLFAAPNGPGYVRVYSGVDASLLFHLDGEEFGDSFGWSCDGAGDVNGDGTPDLICGAPRWRDWLGAGRTGYARVYSGLDGELIQRLQGLQPGDMYGVSVAGDFDIDGDGLSEVFIGCSEDVVGAEGEGYADVHTAMCNPPPLRYCVAAPNSVGAGSTIDFTGSLSVAAANLVLRADGLLPTHFGLFYFGPDQLQLPFGDGFRCVGGSVHRLAIVAADAGGVASHAVDFGSAQAAALVPGSVWNFQHWYRDTGSSTGFFNLSDALQLSICP